jgi:hypothetical protein
MTMLSDGELLQVHYVRQGEEPARAAQLALALKDTGRMQAEIQAVRESLQADLEARAQADYERSPEGKLAAAVAFDKARAEKVELVRIARQKLSADAGVEVTSDADTVLHDAGIVVDPSRLRGAALDEAVESLAARYDGCL